MSIGGVGHGWLLKRYDYMDTTPTAIGISWMRSLCAKAPAATDSRASPPMERQMAPTKSQPSDDTQATNRAPSDAPQMTFERHYSVEQLARMWHLSDDFVRRLFLSEQGVVVFHRAKPGRRVYRTLRIPASVAQRVHRRMTKAG